MGWWGKREEGGTLRCLQVDNENCGGGGVGVDHVDNDGGGDDGGGEDDDHDDNDGVDAQAGV